MKIIVFGSTGAVGKNILNQALEIGHTVTAFTRSPQKFTQSHQNLTVVQGDVLSAIDVESAIAGHDAVICALGMPLMNKDGLREKGTKQIISAMEKTDVKRLICLSGLGAGDSYDLLPFKYKYILVPLLMHHLYADHERQEKLVKASDLDWVIARPGAFSDGVKTSVYQHGFDHTSKIKAKISRADVAEFMLRQLTDDTYLGKTPALSY